MSLVNIRRKTAELMSGDALKCRRCQATAARETLSNYGSLCGPCYGAYCRETRAPAPVSGGRAEWAFSLKARADAGERLTPAQTDAYRAALLRDVSHETEGQA